MVSIAFSVQAVRSFREAASACDLATHWDHMGRSYLGTCFWVKTRRLATCSRVMKLGSLLVWWEVLRAGSTGWVALSAGRSNINCWRCRPMILGGAVGPMLPGGV